MEQFPKDEYILLLLKKKNGSRKKEEETVNLLGTIFSGGVICIWCCSVYSWQRGSVCEIESK